MMFTSSIQQLRSGFSGRATGHAKHAKARAGQGLARRRRTRPRLEHLEDRTAPSVTTTGLPSWIEQGPGPLTSGSLQAAGATEAIASDPLNADRLFVGTVGGGIWRTLNATSATPTWTPLTDQLPSLSIGDVEFSPLDTTNQTLFVATGRFSNGRGDGGARTGLLRTTDGGNTWLPLAQGSLGGQNIQTVVPTQVLVSGQQVVLVGSNTGISRSTDGGNTFTQVLAGNVTDIKADPSNASRFYAAVTNQGVFQSTDGGSTWNAVNTGITGIAGTSRIELAVHNNGIAGTNAVYAALENSSQQLSGLFRTGNQGGTWTAIGNLQQTNPGKQGAANLSLAADPTNQNVVFIAGDQVNVFRVDASTNTWTSVTGGAAGSPHADSRDMVFDANGNILESDDGGTYRLTNPNAAGRVWGPVVGNMRPTELYSVAYDTLNHVIFGGAQDNGSPEQTGHESPPGSAGSLQWTDPLGSDGGIVAVDNTSTPGSSLHYSATQNLKFGFIRQTFDNTNTPTGSANVGLVVNGTGGQTLQQVEAAQTGGSTLPFVVPYALNAVDPTKMLIGTNNLYESTSALAGDALNNLGLVGAVDPATPFGTVANHGNPIAYGGFASGVPNSAVIWLGAGGGLRLRTSGSGLPAAVGTYTGGPVQDIVLDPNDWHTAFILDTNGAVFQAVTDNAGTTVTFTTLTGNLNSYTTDLRTIQIVGSGSARVLLVGGQGGVYATTNPTSNPVWTRLGLGLPNVLVKDIQYSAAADVLVIGTWGRAAWTIPNASAAVRATGVLNINGDTDFAGENDTIRLVREAANPFVLDVFLNNSTILPTFSVSLASLTQINVNGLGGNDTLILDSSNGLINVPNGINYDGGTGFNTLQFVQTGGTTQTSDTYSVGPGTGMGTSTIVGPGSGGTQTVFFQNLAPVTDTVPATTLTVNATPSDNAINYTVGSVAANGKVTIDNFEPIEFSNKDNLAINSLAGTDTVNLNNPNTPTGATPGGLKGITVTGGDPTSFDTLIVNGVAATLGINVGTRSIAGATGTAGAVPVSYNTFEQLIANAGPSTTLAVSGSNSFVYTPGTASDAGALQTTPILVSFTGIGSGKTLALTGLAGSSSLVANGTTANDVFTVAATSGSVTLTGRATITTASIPNLTLNGLAGDDVFNVTGPQPYSNITLAGGTPVTAVVANLTGDGTAVTANLGGTTASVTGGGLGNVSLPGIGVLNLSAGAGAITLAGTSGPDAFTVTPTGANTATAQVGSLAPVVNTTNTGTLAVDAGAGSDTLAVNGTSGADTINVSGTSVAVVGLKSIGYSNVEALQVNGLAGSDTFNVTSSATVPISIDGGDPVGVTPGDLLNVVTNPGDLVAFTPGPTSDSGGFQVNANQPISFVHIESLSVTGGGTPVINGTNGNDVITIIARDSSYAAAADGVQDFTVSVNAGPNFLFINTPSLIVHALAGDDQIVLQAPAPNLAAWNVAVTADGGPSSAVGDQFVMSAPGTDQATYTPTSANSGTLGVTNTAGPVTNVTITDIENFVYDGQVGGDGFTMVGTSGANAFTLTPGAANDAGVLSMDSTLPVTFQNLGTAGQVVVNGNGGADSLVYNGTAANDGFIVNTSALGGQINLNARVPVLTQSIQTLSLEGLAGDDTFTLVPTIAASPYTTLNLDGGATASATGNQANLTAAASTTPLNVSGQTIVQSGNTVAGTSLQNINLNGAGDDLIYTSVVGVTEAINIIASPTAGQGQISSPGVALWSFTNVPIINNVIGQTADNDTLTFTGTNNDDVFQIHLEVGATPNDATPVLQLQTATLSTLLTLTNYSGFQTPTIAGLDGSDVFNVFVAPTGPGRQIFINGDVPSGKKKGTDVLHIFYAKPRPKIVHSTSTQDHDAGLVSLDYGAGLPFFLIQFDGIENVTISQV
jgi:hypothetical protein